LNQKVASEYYTHEKKMYQIGLYSEGRAVEYYLCYC